MITSDGLSGIAPALVKAQSEIGGVAKDGTNPHLRNKYVTLDAMLVEIKPILAANGLTVLQSVTRAEAGHVGITTRILHESGEWMEDTSEFLIENRKGTNAAQDAGTVITYQRRYAIGALFGIVADEDTDAVTVQRNKPAPKKKPVAKQRPVTSKPVPKAVGKVDIGEIVFERKAAEFWPTLKANISRYDVENGLFQVQAAAKKLGYSAVPKGAKDRADMARDIAVYASYRDAGMSGDAAAESVKKARQGQLPVNAPKQQPAPQGAYG